MTIGQAAARAGVNVQTLRYYERRGLLPRPSRRQSGYRDVTDDSVRIVRFVKRAQGLGFTLDEVQELLRLRRERARDRRRVRGVAERRLEQVEQKIAELQGIRDALRHLLHACRHGGTVECPILEALESADRTP